jgi:hypothetical protein
MLTFTTKTLLCAGVLTLTFGLTTTVHSDTELERGEVPTLPRDMHFKKVQSTPANQLVQQEADPHEDLGAEHVHVLHEDALPVPVDPKPHPEAGHAPLIQVAILLDTSNSMDGLIDQAKAQLWMIVNRFAKAQRDGVEPNFQIALFEYGNTSLPAEEGYIRQVVSFTNDLDKVSASLFALKTNGGDEYCGQVIDEALTRLPWSQKANDFKAIYIAGNEPFTQGNVHYVGVSKRARDKGVLVNTIHCGKHEAGVAGKWQHGAHLSGGSYMTINQDRSVAVPEAPQDLALARLNTQLNDTYLQYGDRGAELKEQQAEVDLANSSLSNDAEAARAVTKAGKYYYNGHWDLIDAREKKDFDLAKIPAEQLPEAMREMSLEEKQAHIDKMAKERKAIQEKIKALGAEREKHIAEARREAAEEEGESLGEAINKTIDEQLEEQGYEIKEEQPETKEESDAGKDAETITEKASKKN